jgi:glutamate-1-semialdehyde 2,1-aminomutase
MPGGSTRTSTWFAPYPVWIREGRGARLTDVDGNDYLDVLNNYTSLIHGHAHPAIVRAIRRQAGRGTAFGAPDRTQVELARLLVERFGADQVRFTNSGTEAVMQAVRVARAFTGRRVVAKVEGAYHGSWDGIAASTSPDLRRAGPADRPVAVPDGPDIDASRLRDLVILPFNRLDDARRILEGVGEHLAAVIVEPVNARGGMIPADAAFLEGLRAVTRALGAVLILDEVITARLAPGGAQSGYGVRPDLTVLGKIVGGGLPIGAVMGRADMLALVDPRRSGHLEMSGTFNGNPLTMVAGRVAMELMTPGEYERINGLGSRLRAGIEAAGRRAGVPVVATGAGSLLNVHLSSVAVHDYRDMVTLDAARRRRLHLALLEEGIFAASRGLMCISTPMDEGDVDAISAGVGRALGRLDLQPAMA